MIVKSGGVITLDGDITWFKPYGNKVMYSCILATYVDRFPARGNWILYVELSQNTGLHLYLFKTVKEYKLWEKLKSISSLGPRRAAMVLSFYTSDKL